MTTKLEQTAREVIRQHSMECLSDKAITALREALAEQAEQEPVAWLNESEGVDMYAFSWRKKDGFDTPLYAAPVRTKDLTDDEIADVGSKLAAMNIVGDIAFARAVIEKFKENNHG